ncbi:MAG: manganese-binding transcriptional regulator MntR [Phycisphaerales bacterium]|nr:manganese-binding transcriptional regulator MntR [Phycisphaerales bacterium]
MSRRQDQSSSAKDAAPRATPSDHARLRTQHASERAEDYCEAIQDAINATGESRVVHLARRFGLSHVTVSRTIARLQREGLLETAPYKPILLTPKGRKLAEAARARHELVHAFLLKLGIDDATARIDAEGIEHHVSPATIEAFAKFLSAHRA